MSIGAGGPKSASLNGTHPGLCSSAEEQPAVETW